MADNHTGKSMTNHKRRLAGANCAGAKYSRLFHNALRYIMAQPWVSRKD